VSCLTTSPGVTNWMRQRRPCSCVRCLTDFVIFTRRTLFTLTSRSVRVSQLLGNRFLNFFPCSCFNRLLAMFPYLFSRLSGPLPLPILVTFCMRHSRGKMYIGCGRLCVGVSVCLSVTRIPTLLHRPRCNLGEW